MDLLADENVPKPIIESLRTVGFNIRAISERAAGAVDADVLATAAQLVLIAQDQDFGELAILRALPISGVVLLEIERLPLSAQAERVAQVVTAESERLAGNFTVIEPARVRVRKLPQR